MLANFQGTPLTLWFKSYSSVPWHSFLLLTLDGDDKLILPSNTLSCRKFFQAAGDLAFGWNKLSGGLFKKRGPPACSANPCIHKWGFKPTQPDDINAFTWCHCWQSFVLLRDPSLVNPTKPQTDSTTEFGSGWLNFFLAYGWKLRLLQLVNQHSTWLTGVQELSLGLHKFGNFHK